MHWISVLLGLVFAWAILFFIGPKPRVVSYYEPEVEEPVVGVTMSELDAMMKAVGLISESMMETVYPAHEMSQVAPLPAPELLLFPVPEPVLTVADVAMIQEVEDLSDQDTGSIPLAYAPSPAPTLLLAREPSPQN
jgi:hypothetical protein